METETLSTTTVPVGKLTSHLADALREALALLPAMLWPRAARACCRVG